jgi:hypothetical protein
VVVVFCLIVVEEPGADADQAETGILGMMRNLASTRIAERSCAHLAMPLAMKLVALASKNDMMFLNSTLVIRVEVQEVRLGSRMYQKTLAGLKSEVGRRFAIGEDLELAGVRQVHGVQTEDAYDCVPAAYPPRSLIGTSLSGSEEGIQAGHHSLAVVEGPYLLKVGHAPRRELVVVLEDTMVDHLDQGFLHYFVDEDMRREQVQMLVPVKIRV